MLARERKPSVAATRRRWLGGWEGDEFVQQTGKHGRPLVYTQHIGAGSFHDLETLAPETQPQRPRVTATAEASCSEERLKADTHNTTRHWCCLHTCNAHTRRRITNKKLSYCCELADRTDRFTVSNGSLHACFDAYAFCTIIPAAFGRSGSA